MKKILLVSRAFYPEISPRSFRATELAKEFARQGHEVEAWIPYSGFDYSTFQKQHRVCVKYLGFIKQWPNSSPKNCLMGLVKRFLSRGLSLLFEYPDIQLMFLIPRALNGLKGYDILISIAAPHTVHWGVNLAFRNNSGLAKKWIADCGDPYMGVTLETFRKPFYFKYFEKSFCRRADFITVPVEGAVEAYYPEFRHKIKVIPQGFRMDGVKRFEGVINNRVPTFAYAGSIALKGVRNILPLLEYLKCLKRNFRFYIYTDATYKELLGYEKELSGKLILESKIERLKLIYELSKMDFLVNLENGTSRQIPSKLMDYALTGRPILNFYSLKPDFNVLNEFLESNFNNQYRVNNIQQYNIINVAKEFLRLAE